MKIFLAEDSLAARGQLAAMLATIPGAQLVGEADSATSAIRGILTLQPDLVLLDVHLAEGSGFDVLTAVHLAAPQIEFCMLTSFSAQAYRDLAEEFGARAVFDKSNEFDRVRELVAQRAARCTLSKEAR